MIIKQIYSANAFCNYYYFIVCSETNEALIIDPIDAINCIDISKSNKYSIKQIVNTHEHGDHTAGNEKVKELTGATLLAFTKLKKLLPHVDRWLSEGEIINVGKSVKLKVLYTPGHTMAHVSLFSSDGIPSLFSGDALFNAGAGNCYNNGDPKRLYKTFTECFAKLPGNTRVYPGHDYLINNLRFTLDREPDNNKAKELLEKVKNQNPHNPFISTIDIEKEINTFFRLTSNSLIERLRDDFPKMPENPSTEDVFIMLRTLRNSW